MSRTLPASHSVSVGWQIVFTFVPILNFWAFYRIRKLRKNVLCIVVPSLALSVVLVAYHYYSITSYEPILDRAWNSVESINRTVIYDPLSPQAFYSRIIGDVIGNVIGLIGLALQGFAVYLVIIWSREHNRNFAV